VWQITTGLALKRKGRTPWENILLKMELLQVTPVIFLTLTLVVGLFPTIFIAKFISQKSPSSLTLIDLIYRDCIFLNYVVNFNLSVGNLGCLISPDTTLDFIPAFTIAASSLISTLLLTMSLFISGLLRLLTLITKSEEFGIQLLGPDDIAIWVVRAISFTFSIILYLTAALVFQILPGFFYVFYHDESFSVQSFKQATTESGTFIYILPNISAIIVNILCMVISIYHKCKNWNNAQTLSFSVGSTILFSCLLMAGIAASLLSRQYRLIFVYPLLIFSFLVLFPVYIIIANDKMKTKMINILSDSIDKVFGNLFTHFPITNTSQVHPTMA
jgi:hypothetical protein